MMETVRVKLSGGYQHAKIERSHLTLSGLQPDFSGCVEHHYKTSTVGLMQSKSPFHRRWLVSGATQFSLKYITAYYIVCIHTNFARDLWRNTTAMGHCVRLPIFLVFSVRRVRGMGKHGPRWVVKLSKSLHKSVYTVCKHINISLLLAIVMNTAGSVPVRNIHAEIEVDLRSRSLKQSADLKGDYHQAKLESSLPYGL